TTIGPPPATTLPAGSSGFLVQFSETTFTTVSKPVSDFDNTGRSQLAIYRPATAQWFAIAPPPVGGHLVQTFGAINLYDIPVPGDYDGVGYAEPAVYRPSTSEWIVLGPNGVHTIAAFGTPNLSDIPAPGDYDGVGHMEVAVFRPSQSITIVQGGPAGFHVL